MLRLDPATNISTKKLVNNCMEGFQEGDRTLRLQLLIQLPKQLPVVERKKEKRKKERKAASCRKCRLKAVVPAHAQSEYAQPAVASAKLQSLIDSTCHERQPLTSCMVCMLRWRVMLWAKVLPMCIVVVQQQYMLQVWAWFW